MFSFAESLEHFQGNIFDYLSPEEIYQRYLGYTPKTDQFYNSPFGKDKTPSFRFYKKGNELLFKDFSSGYGGDAIQLVRLLTNSDYKTAINKIANNFKVKTNHILIDKPQYDTVIKVIEVNLFNKIPNSFYAYWQQFEVNPKILRYFDILPAQYVWLNDALISSYKDDKPLIRYRVNSKYKIYSPYDKAYKWLSTTKGTDIFALNKIPAKGKTLVISKSMKDILVWAVLGIPAIAMCSEKVIIQEEILNDLKKRFSRIIVFLDNDTSGLEAMEKYHKKYKLPCYCLPLDMQKDIADYVKDNSVQDLKKLLKTLNPINYDY